MIEIMGLKSCLFCDSISIVHLKIGNSCGYIIIDCPDCEFSFMSDRISSDTPIDRFINEYEALVNRWNKRCR